MISQTENVFSSALNLPDDERVELIEALIVSLQTDDRPPLSDSWRAIIKRRSAELRSGSVSSIPWSEVKRLARENAGG